MYRAVTYISLLKKITPELASTFFEKRKMKLTTENSKNSLFYENKDITTLLYSKNIDSKVSEVSKKSIVRNNLVDFQRNLAIEGILVTMYDGRLNLSRQVVKELEDYFENKVYKTYIHRNVRLGEAPSHGKPILLYDASCIGAQNYMNLVSEILIRNEK